MKDIPDIVREAFNKAYDKLILRHRRPTRIQARQNPEKFGGVNRSQRYLIAGIAECDIRSVDNFLRGESIQPGTAMRIQNAADELGVVVPKRLVMR